MESYSEEDGVQFFDTREEMSDVGSNCSEDCSSSPRIKDSFLDSFGYEFWTKSPVSVHERRHKFKRWMGLSLDENTCATEEGPDIYNDRIEVENGRIMENSGAVLRTLNYKDDCSLSQSFVSSRSNESMELAKDVGFEENSLFKSKELQTKEFVTGELGQNGTLSRLCEVGSNLSVTIEEFKKSFGSSSLIQQVLQREKEKASKSRFTTKKAKRGWLRSAVGCIAHGQIEVGLESSDSDRRIGARIRRVRVNSHKKRCKELSSLLSGQEFAAHEGSIIAMKFSPDGRYLASGGEDCVVRVWKVIEVERANEFGIEDIDPSNLNFGMTHDSKLSLLSKNEEKLYKMKKAGISSDTACVIFPPKVFKLSEKPIHEFQGHSDAILDLSWSKKGYLLSSSVDKTVRLWQVGCNRCLRIFSHNNYVTSVDFNPVNDSYFISGSIDGKVRIWEVLGCRVFDWIDVKEIVTAVCYRPDGKGGIVGSMTGNCRFYDIIDNHLELEAQICLQGKKKLQGKRITGFQFSPSDPSKVMVTSADSVVRILSGVDVIFKYKVGLRDFGSQLSASFSSDGKHIVSASEESNVYIWNYTSQERSNSKTKKISSYESFLSHNASFAIPWCGMSTVSSTHHERPSFYSPDCFSLSRGFLLESLPKGKATWPEEKLSNSSPMPLSPSICKSKYKFLKSACHGMSGSPHMWGSVIVTAGWDGRIRTYQNYGLPIRL